MNASSPFFERIRMDGNPVANPGSMIVSGQARFTVLTLRLIRLEWSADGSFEDRGTFAFPHRHTESVPPFTHQTSPSGATISTEFLSLRYTDDGKPFHAGNLSIRLNDTEWTPGTPPTGNLFGAQRTLDQCAGAIYLQQGLLSRDGWTLFDNSRSVVWDESRTWVQPRSEAHEQDWYFFGYGRDYRAQLKEYMQFGGSIPLVPRYVLGGWWSRFWAYHAEDLKQLVRDFDAHDIPLDVLVVDMDWHTPVAWTGYSWNRDLFPDPEGFLAWVHAQKLQVTFNLHPAQGVQKHEDIYPEFAQRMGIDPASGQPVACRVVDKKFMQNYFELLHHPMEEQGVDFWWLDWQQGDSSDMKNLDPLPWLNHLHHRDSTRRGIRPMLYSRWGGLGNHRYPIGFSGDTYSTWESLKFLPYFTATGANVGYGWWSHDIGGHLGAVEPELYARWVQFGAVNPCLRLHSTKDPLAERRPWAFTPEVNQAAKAAFRFRYRLLPYLYSAARAASQDGVSLCYPMYYDHPESEDAYLARSQYHLGSELIAAPIVSPADKTTGLASTEVWIPKGIWIEFTTLETFFGPCWKRLSGDLNHIPLLAKSGAIVPLAPEIKRTQDFDGSYIILTMFTGAKGYFELYEDDGNTDNYQQGEYEITPVTLIWADIHMLEVTIGAAKGGCPGLPERRTFELRFRGVSGPEQVKINRTLHTDWKYDADAREMIVFIRDVSRRIDLEVAVSLEDASFLYPPARVPFFHTLEYTVYDEAKQQTGTLIVAPPAANTPFDVEIEWTLQQNGETTVKTETRQNCLTRQIVSSPFADDGSCSTFRWNVSARLTWQGETFDYRYTSKEAYPALNHWQTLIYNREQQPLKLPDILATDGSLNAQLNWQAMNQTPNQTFNLQHPYGPVLLERERKRITSGEPLEAVLSTVISSQQAKDAVLLLQLVGEAKCYLNGVELQRTESVDHETLQPMFYSWLIPELPCYTLPLQPGENRLVIVTRPTVSIGWWALGAHIYDRTGKMVM